jgi:putative ABC transport system substrate-binding protein
MRRRDVLAAVAGATAWAARSRAAQRGNVVIGYLFAGTARTDTSDTLPFWKALAELGYVQGQNARMEYRVADNDVSRLPELARDLVRRQVDVIFVPASGPALMAAKAATSTIPIIFANSGDPMKTGFVPSLSRPGGNVTGVSDFGDELSGKRLELIKQMVPTASRIGILTPRNYAGLSGEVARAREIAPTLSLETVESTAVNLHDIDAALASFAQGRIDGVYFTPGPVFYAQREQVAALAMRYRLPAIYSFSEFSEAGGLMSYGISVAERLYEGGRYTGLVLNGANPGDLPVRRLAKFHLVINLSTAKALGLTIPAQLLALTDEVVQ